MIAKELILRGADAFLINGAGKYTPPYWIPHQTIKTFEEYRDLIEKSLLEKKFTAGIFSSSVADYAPLDLKEGKMPSGKKKLLLELRPTEKIIEKVRKSHKDLLMVTFKYEENISKEDLLKKAGNRLKDYPLIVANRKEDFINGEQVAWIMTSKKEAIRVQGKEEIAKAIIDSLELIVEEG
jgi:phosphopantothenoylcysteine decarboxylase/phosphopantothenate--cysteine ligase